MPEGVPTLCGFPASAIGRKLFGVTASGTLPPDYHSTFFFPLQLKETGMMHPFRHFLTITRHRHQVIRHCFRAGIGAGGLKHDLSKYSPAEFWVGAR